MTLLHSTVVRSSIIHFLVYTGVLNQLCLISLVVQIIYVLLNEANLIGNGTLNVVLCKAMSYAVKTLTFLNKWSIAYVNVTIVIKKLSKWVLHQTEIIYQTPANYR